MESENRYTGLDQDISTIIRRKARQLVGHAGFTSSDIPDLEQELFIVILEHIHKFDANKGSKNAFLRCLIERHAGKLVKSRQVQCRNWRLSASFDDAASCSEFFLADDEYIELEESLDVERVLEILPDELAQLTRQLTIMMPAEIAKNNLISRYSIYRKIEKIRLYVQKYLPAEPHLLDSAEQLTKRRRKK